MAEAPPAVPPAVPPAPGDAPESVAAEEKPPLIDAKMWAVIAVFIIVMLLVFAAPTLIVLFIGLLPAVVAAVVDKKEERYATYSVFSLNACGVFPFIFNMWADEHTFRAALETVTSPYAMAVMYSAAAFGWMIYLSVPPVIAQFLSVLAQRRVSSLRGKQRELIEEWGVEAAGGADISALGLTPPPAGDDDDDDDGDDDISGSGSGGGLAPPG